MPYERTSRIDPNVRTVIYYYFLLPQPIITQKPKYKKMAILSIEVKIHDAHFIQFGQRIFENMIENGCGEVAIGIAPIESAIKNFLLAVNNQRNQLLNVGDGVADQLDADNVSKFLESLGRTFILACGGKLADFYDLGIEL